jgi:hypothetical protein
MRVASGDMSAPVTGELTRRAEDVERRVGAGRGEGHLADAGHEVGRVLHERLRRGVDRSDAARRAGVELGDDEQLAGDRVREHRLRVVRTVGVAQREHRAGLRGHGGAGHGEVGRGLGHPRDLDVGAREVAADVAEPQGRRPTPVGAEGHVLPVARPRTRHLVRRDGGASTVDGEEAGVVTAVVVGEDHAVEPRAGVQAARLGDALVGEDEQQLGRRVGAGRTGDQQHREQGEDEHPPGPHAGSPWLWPASP